MRVQTDIILDGVEADPVDTVSDNFGKVFPELIACQIVSFRWGF
jgi:hypothetical protein